MFLCRVEVALGVSRRQSLKRLAAAGAIPLSAPASPRIPAPSVRLIVLDVGGTIIEDRGDVPEALRSAMAHHGVPSNREEIARRRGASKREVIRHFVDEQAPPPNVDRDRLIADIHAEFTANLIEVYRSVPPIAGAEDAIRQLRAGGFLVATTTGFDRAISTSIFRRLGWEGLFAASICSDDVAQGRPAPYMIFHAMEAALVNSVAEVVAVGDTPLDLQAGNNAGVRGVVGVLTGAAAAENLRKQPHTEIVPSVADLPALLASRQFRPKR
ncbi:MAG: HAD hydrolase-like protein [Bryobacteraceae bacterium]|nr:HAD hydrolase-like protein [Bryobacteraceae bacterium]